jgi:hypothetical protein
MMNQSKVLGLASFVFFLAGAMLPASLAAQANERPSEATRSDSDGGGLGRAKRDTDSDRNQETESILNSLQMDFAFGDSKPFRQVLGELSTQSGLQFFLDDSAQDGDLTRETEISFSAESIRMRTGLEMMLKQYNATFVIRDGAVVIISFEAASDPAYFRRKMFDVENLLQLMIRTQGIKEKAYMMPAELFGPNGHGADGFSGMTGMFALPRGLEGAASALVAKNGVEVSEVQPKADAADSQNKVEPAKYVKVTYSSARSLAGELLIELVQGQVCPDDWAETGNGDGVIEVAGGVLVVSQTEDALNQVASMLGELERKLEAIDSRAKKE